MEAMPFCERFSREARDFSHERTSQAYQEALYETALEHGLSHDDLECAFGGNFVAEMEDREQMQQVEQNTDDPNLE